MKLKIAVLTVALAALGASGAMAAKPAHPTHPTTPASTNAAKPTVMFVIHGKITAYTPANGATNGSVTLAISGSNHAAKALKGQTIAFAVASTSKVVGTVTVGHNAVVKWRSTKAPNAPVSVGAVTQLIDQGTSS
jgi:hypothetical protein